MTDNPRTWLEARLGLLAEFETLDSASKNRS
jgi:hypothetical protein